MHFQKLGNCGSPFEIYTSAILVNQWPPNRIFCLLLGGNSEICITFFVFHRTWCLTTPVLCFEPKKLTLSALYPHIFIFTSGYQRYGYPPCIGKGVTGGRTNRRTDRSVLRAAWSQLKIWFINSKAIRCVGVSRDRNKVQLVRRACMPTIQDMPKMPCKCTIS